MSEASPLRVLSIAHTAVSRAAGRLRYAPLAERHDLDVHLVVPARWRQFGRDQQADPAGDPGLTVHVLPALWQRGGPFSWYLHVYPGLRRVVRATRPAVIHLWEEPWSLVALQATLLRAEAAIVLEVDQNILKRLPPPFEAIRRFVLARTGLVLARSPDAAAVVRACGYAGPILPVGYGVDLATFHPNPSGDPSRHDRTLTAGYVGRLVAEKGLDDALDAMARARADVRLEIMGEGPEEGALRARAEALGLAGRVAFHRWGTPDAVASFLRSLDVSLLLTRTTGKVKEQFGRIIIESQACGVPVIGSACGAIPDVVADGGWIVPEGDPSGLARLLDDIAASPNARRDKAEAARRNVEARFTFGAIASTLASAWRQAAAERPR